MVNREDYIAVMKMAGVAGLAITDINGNRLAFPDNGRQRSCRAYQRHGW